MYANFGKRCLDFLIALILLIILIIPFIILAITIKLDSKGPVMFLQRRVGRNMEPFMIYKFRTMRIDAPSEMPTNLLDNPLSYITKVGRFLRISSLDELPQLINILKGEMSFIGPRPVLFNQEYLLAQREKVNANSVRPGLTGLAQAHGRDELPDDDKARLDGEYVKNITFLNDLRIILDTVKSVLFAEGYKEGSSR